MKRSRLNPVSAKRAAELAAYKALTTLLAPLLPSCAKCGAPRDDWHHPYGRGRGRYLWKTLIVLPLCRPCHDALHGNPTEARRQGLLVDFRP